MPCERKYIEEMIAHWRTLDNVLIINGNMDEIKAGIALDACLREALAACDESPWRSMESAPKDGVPVLLRFTDGRPDVGSWFSTSIGGWWTCHCVHVHPTHWMPLPEAPEAFTDATAVRGERGE